MTWVTPLIGPAIYLVGSLLISLVFAGRSRGVGLAFNLGLLGVSLCLGAPVLFAQALLLAILAGVQFAARLTWRSFAVGGVLVTATTLAFIGARPDRMSTMINELRAEFPVMTLDSRLSYESRWHSTTATADSEAIATVTSPQLSDELKRRSDGQQLSGRPGPSVRERTLQYLHQDTFRQFLLAYETGLYRIPWVHPGSVRLPRRQLITLTCERNLEDPMPAGQPEPSAAEQLGFEKLHELHWKGTGDFLDSERFGYVESRSHVVGFEPHAFAKVPDFQSEVWRVTRLELVSLLKHAEPRVYESEFLPNMAELSSDSFPTRELDDFEATALPQLRADRDVVIEDLVTSKEIRMLGALRADRDCLQCHSVRRGELLGAFSYRLRPLR